jgi:predicted HAD superfamily Cof-like phosphohydrolase
MVKTHFEKVLEFFKGFNQHIPSGPASLDESSIPEERVHLKLALIAEEFTELVEAVYGKRAAEALNEGWEKAKTLDDKNRDIIETADALADIDYVVNGFAIEAGINLDAVFNEVHDSNMSKLDENGKPILSDGTDGHPLGKILKGPHYFRPNIPKVLKNSSIKESNKESK